MKSAIETDQVGRVYKIRGGKKSEPRTLVALDNVTLQVNQGELFGLLGPNGAGKTTLIKILTTLLAPTTGKARVAGFDVQSESQLVRQRINMVSGGESSGYGLLTVRENLWMFAQFYGISTNEANQRIKDLLEAIGMADRLNAKSSDLSTGLRQKMNIVRGFLTDPEVLFMDEPTLGLDVNASREVRQFIKHWVSSDPTRTLLLTTHYMVEAEELCERVAIINKGKVLACDTPTNLKRLLRKEATFHLEVTPGIDGSLEKFQSIDGVRRLAHLPQDGFSKLELSLEEDDVISSFMNALTESHLHISNLQKHEPTLEDVFIELVGRSMEEVEQTVSE